MKYTEFEEIVSKDRLERYMKACDGNSRKAMALYRENLRLSQEVFTLLCCFEVALRNAIDKKMRTYYGDHWLRDFVLPGGRLDNPQCRDTQQLILKAYDKLMTEHTYKPSKLLSSLSFGTWKYFFAKNPYRLMGKVLLSIFPNKPKSSAEMQYNNTYVFNELDKVNTLRNRIAHHEQICFTHKSDKIDTSYIVNEYQKIQAMFAWMNIDASALLYGLDHVIPVCKKLNSL